MTETDEQPWREERGLEIRAQARRAYGRALRKARHDPRAAEVDVRTAIRLAASALNWLEGTPLESTAHHDLHQIGRFAREELSEGCRLHWTGQSYEIRCPVRIGHKRFGLSPGMIVKETLCSLCGEDISDCPHARGTFYEIDGGFNHAGYCRVCAKKDCSDNEHGRGTHRVRPIGIITEAELEEVSIVAKPAQPDARLSALPVDTEQLGRHLGPNFQAGMRVNCDYCLGRCPGFDYLKPPSGESG